VGRPKAGSDGAAIARTQQPKQYELTQYNCEHLRPDLSIAQDDN
jgi:hypothetical protein